MEEKHGVVLGGGGARGAYEVGVWKALRELSFHVDVVAGTSIGALNGAMMVEGNYEKAVALWETLDDSQMHSMNRPIDMSTFKNSVTSIAAFAQAVWIAKGLDGEPLKRILETYVSEDNIRASAIELGMVTVEFPSAKPCVMYKEDIPKGQLADYIMASAACFPIMKTHEIGGKKYIDGGYRNNLPISLAYEKGARVIVAVDLDTMPFARPKIPKDCKVIPIHSKKYLGLSFHFKPEKNKQNITLGYLDTLRAFGVLEGGVYAFEKGESLKNYRRLKKEAKEKVGNVYLPKALSIEQRFIERIFKKLSLQYDCKNNRSSFLRGMAEALGECCDMDRTETYTFEGFNNFVYEQTKTFINAISKEQFDSYINQMMEEKEFIKGIKDVIALLDNKTLVCFFVYLQSGAEQEGIKKQLLWMLATLKPFQFCGAVYYLILEASRQNEKTEGN